MTPEESELLTEYASIANQRRGGLLNQIIALERSIDYYIATHFCSEEKYVQEFHELILSTERVTFSAKIQILQYLLDKYDQSVLVNNPKFIDKLTGIMKRRNVFAHYQLDTSLEAANHFKKTGEITLIKYTNGVELKRYSKEKVQSISDDAFNAFVPINDLNKARKPNR